MFSAGSGNVMAASVPERGEAIDLGGTFGTFVFPPTADERNTCSPDFWHVMNNRAWQEAQREITQNNNLIPRPDSVLSLSCFDEWLDNLGAYTGYTSLGGDAGNFPGNPRHSDDNGFLSLNGLWLDIYMSTGFGGNILTGGETAFLALDDPYKDPLVGLSGTNGFFMYGLLEILVLDQLVRDVSNLSEAEDAVYLLACGGAGSKKYYIDENFPELMIGDRAMAEGGPPAWNAIRSWATGGGRSDVPRSGNPSVGCQRMNDVWFRTQCYDFATESHLDISPPGSLAAKPRLSNGVLHDAFYPIWEYVANAAANDDYRIHETECRVPYDSSIPPGFSDSDFIDPCMLQQHADIANGDVTLKFPALIPPPTGGAPGVLGTAVNAAVSAMEGAFGGPVPGLTSDGEFNFGITDAVPTWSSTDTIVNRDPGQPGQLDAYNGFFSLIDGAAPSCADPIMIGFVKSRGANHYVDSVCPTPGCWFNPPSGGSASSPATGGSCSR